MMEARLGGYDGDDDDNIGDKHSVDPPQLPRDPTPSEFIPSSSHEGGFQEEIDFSDEFLKHVNQILMEEDIEGESCIQESSLALRAAEKSFYEAIGAKYPPPPNSQLTSSVNENSTEPQSNCNLSDHRPSSEHTAVVDLNPQPSSQSLFSLTSTGAQIVDGFVESQGNNSGLPDIFTKGDFNLNFRRGVEEASLLLRRDHDSFLNLTANEDGHFIDASRGKKKSHFEDADLECGRRNAKQSAVYTEPTLISEMFDKLLLSTTEKGESALRKALQSKVSKNDQKDTRSRGSSSEKVHRTKQAAAVAAKRDFVDLKTLLILCAQAITADNRRGAADILKQIRRHSSPTGDAMQRLASYFADGLEARMAGYGTHRYTELLTRPSKAIDVLKSHLLFHVVYPNLKISYFFSNKTIMHVAKRATRLHIIDFGMSYGFQWPSFIERLSCRPGGPLKLRITGIDFPRPGFRPGQLIEETGRRLAIYAERFNVPFEFNLVAQSWETIRKEHIKIKENEVLVVNCLHRFKHVPDVGVGLESPRNMVLNLIKDLNPKVFIQGVMNGAQSSPFFINRFQEAISFYSTFFDMCETITPGETPERIAVEAFYGREIMNLVACEGSERVERPETYKQWQIRKERVGFKQLPLNKEIVRIAKEKVASIYHEHFLVDEDGQWLVLGWKGRITSALSSCKPSKNKNIRES